MTTEIETDKPVSRYVSKDPAKRARQLANLAPPWKPGQVANPAGRPKSKTFEEEARSILDMGVLPKLREIVALKSGLPLYQVDKMTTRQALVILLLVDYVAKGKIDAVDRILDRTDPKSRRVSHDGAIDLRAVAVGVLDLDEEKAADIYKDMLKGGTLEAEVIEDAEVS